ncbi:hypothetical protein HYALB_00006832 [Hymenoscyphus albidus]|uniref:Uncharacterized protein n=1 Tax=Hymenoscyphus albidus TaxID=595503 RepID=A0A9N9LJL7_9HELO|nr:hypothetical protein HYALB_00006832 [Hymenoscyphus albidus]
MSTTFYMNISQLFDVSPDLTSECIGTSSKNNAFHRQISANTRAGASTTLYSLERLELIDELLNQLQSIAGKLLCHQHYFQRDIMCKRWCRALLDIYRNSLPFHVPGGFPEEDQTILAAILELWRLKVDSPFPLREEEAERAQEERAEEERAAKRAEVELADETRRSGKPRQPGYQEWPKNSRMAWEDLENVPFPDPPSYGCGDKTCEVFRNKSRVQWCRHGYII